MLLKLSYKVSFFLTKSRIMAEIIECDDVSLKRAAEHLSKGNLVAFPTETVYGLGSILVDESLKKIFEYKKRPFSDPLITHFHSADQARKYLILTEEEDAIFRKLADAFWPGPLTIVGPAISAVPPLVMAGTGNVGVRVPSNEICRKILLYCNKPIAAPSANLYGHVSPTTYRHVVTDLGDVNGLYIVKGGSSEHGVESTVVRLHGKMITILRPGFITARMIEDVCGTVVNRDTTLKEKLSSPGHDTRHYAPNMPTYLCRKVESDGVVERVKLTDRTVLIDFNMTYADKSSEVLRYFDLSPIGKVEDAMKNVYNTLREAESTPGAETCVICDILESGDKSNMHDSELIVTLRDRLLRSASHLLRVLS